MVFWNRARDSNPVNPVNPVNVHPLLLATRNPHKTREFAALLGGQFVVRDLSDESDAPTIEETGSSFEENAILKATETARQFRGLVVADASIMPDIPSANTHIPTIMIAERIASLLVTQGAS